MSTAFLWLVYHKIGKIARRLREIGGDSNEAFASRIWSRSLAASMKRRRCRREAKRTVTSPWAEGSLHSRRLLHFSCTAGALHWKKTNAQVRWSFFWLGCRDSNPGNVRVRVWCLTAWRHPNIENTKDYSRLCAVCQGGFEKFSALFFFLCRYS